MSLSLFSNTIIQGECLQVMRALPDQSIDLVLCDLPYGCTDNSWDTIIPYDLLWREYTRLVKPTGYVILTAQGMFTAELMCSNRRRFSHKLVWVKHEARGFLNARRLPLRKHEDILIFRMGSGSPYNPQFTFGHKPYVNNGARINSTNYSRVKYRPDHVTRSDGRRFPVDVLEFPPSPLDQTHIHPTQKPVEMGRYIVRQYTNPGAVVLDNCCGSGSFPLSATLEGRTYIGIDASPDYVAGATARIEAALKSAAAAHLQTPR